MLFFISIYRRIEGDGKIDYISRLLDYYYNFFFSLQVENGSIYAFLPISFVD